MKDLIERIDIAISSYTNKTDSMHVPPKEIDIDFVLSDCRDELLDLKQQLSEAHKSRASWVEYSQKIESGEFVLMPRKPTNEMLRAAYKHVMDCHATPESAYKVMIEVVESGKFNSNLQAMNKDLSNGVITGENFNNLSDDQSSGERP